MKILIVYHYRLGDIIRMFPAARALANIGHQVFIECLPQYWGIFGAVSYVLPVAPGTAQATAWDFVYRPQIWPDRYDAFRASGKTWMDFIYGMYQDWVNVNRQIVFDRLQTFPAAMLREEYGLPEKYQAIFPFSYSSRPVSVGDILRMAAEKTDMDENCTFLFMAPEQRQMLLDHGFEPSKIRCVLKLADLPAVIRQAHTVLTVNTSTTIIASAVRDPDPAKARYFHVLEPNRQDNHTAPNQTVLIP